MSKKITFFHNINYYSCYLSDLEKLKIWMKTRDKKLFFIKI